MDGAAPKTQVTPLLSNEQLARAERLRLNASRRFTARTRGEHLSGRGGSSNEFSDYRQYVAGDDLRFVDWNIFSRLRRPYLKLFHEEEQMHVAILIDASASMDFEGKLDAAKSLAAALGVMGLMNAELVSVHVFNEPGERIRRLSPKRGRASMRQVFRFIEAIEPGGQAPLEVGVDAMLAEHRGRGVAVVLSDFLTRGDMRRSLNNLFSAGLETFAVQILGPTEIDPDLTGDVRMIDSETAATLDVSAVGDLVTLYHEYRLAMEAELDQLCRQRLGRFLPVSSQTPVDELLTDHFMRKGWVR